MAVKLYKPTTPGRRGMTTRDFSEITTSKPLKSLLVTKKITAGRNNKGRITTRHKGGGVKRHIRNLNFNLAAGTVATIEQIEYDPGRSANIARIKDQEGEFHYILAAKGMKKGMKIESGAEAPVSVGNRLPLNKIPAGSVIHAIELTSGRGAQMVRSAGNSAQLIAKEDDYCQVRLPSGEVRKVLSNCMASIGNLGNEQHQNVKYGKAGRKRLMGIRPSVRGVVMNAADHPHGGGDGGRHGIGGGVNHGSAPRTPWGQKTLGYKTRSRSKTSNKFIVKSRHEAKRK
ncbi:MAG: large subunit ribosomal protein L2 [Candidatus Saccharimonadales bacterium]|jgi:large subunit ribosomal protein L2